MKKSTNSQLGLGTAAIGRPLYINIKSENANEIVSKSKFIANGTEALDFAYQNGIRYFDTAPGYGIAEQMLIDWLANKNDESIEIATKWGYTYVANFDPKAAQHEVKEHSLPKLNEQWLKSKSLMPFLTTYQVHSATLDTGVLDNDRILRRLSELQNQYGLQIGITTTGENQVEVLKKAMDIAVDGKALFDVYQVTYNIFDQDLARVATSMARLNKRLIIKEALANGRIFPNMKYAHYMKAYSCLSQLAQKYDVGIDAIALRFCMDTVPVYKVLSGASNIEQLADNIKSLQFSFEPTDLGDLKRLAVDPSKYWSERKQLAWN